jgi:hypothetical protein
MLQYGGKTLNGSLKSRLGVEYGPQITRGSVIPHEPFIDQLVRILQPKSVLEIGTYRGLSAALWASLVERVVTVDIAEKPIAREVWKKIGVQDKISYHIISSDAEKRNIARSQKFDLAFVDGDHRERGVQFDFESVNHCRWVLFHDYKPNNPNYHGLVKFVDGLQPKPLILGIPGSQFALWFKEEQPELAAQIKSIRYMPIQSEQPPSSRAKFSGWWNQLMHYARL